jgi:hypothetical protein
MDRRANILTDGQMDRSFGKTHRPMKRQKSTPPDRKTYRREIDRRTDRQIDE